MNYKIYIHNVDNKLPVYINNNDIISDNIINYKENRYLNSQYSLEIIFHKLILNYNYIIDNIDLCDIIYIPLYIFLLAWVKDYYYDVDNIIYNINIYKDFINEYSNLGKKILLVYSDVMWEDDRCFINYFNFHKNVYIVCYESVIDKYLNNQIVVPYITHISCNPKNYIIPYNNDKKNLISYAGRYRNELSYFDISNICFLNTNKYQEIKDQWISYNNETMYDEIDDIYLNSYFSLQPHGDKKSRKGFYHSLLLGCIPVLFENNYIIYHDIFKNIVNINDIAIIINNNEITTIEEKLKNNINNINNMIININKIKHLLLYYIDNDENNILNHVINKMYR